MLIYSSLPASDAEIINININQEKAVGVILNSDGITEQRSKTVKSFTRYS